MRRSFYKNALLLLALFQIPIVSTWAQNATIKEYKKVFTTYPFSDPDQVPKVGKIYPYFRFDGYTDKPVQKEWKVVELENDYIKLMVLPEIGGKVWAAIEKSTGKPFIYYNHVVKFRDIAMRGPWTSGGLEPNFGIIGHTPNCATPVDYTIVNRPDGSVSCVVGVLDLLTRTSWRVDINLPKDKAYFTTSSFWYSGTPIEQAYYTWMNTGLPAKGNLEFIYPGTKYIGHAGEYADWPVNKQNEKNISFYENNDFGGPKSYHVFGKYTDFFGAYWHDDDFGMGRYSNHDAKPGKKIWIWGLSPQGMIWEKLLTDTDGQYVEVQSGRLYNQAAEQSTFTPFKHTGFTPHGTDVWTEYWFPVLKTKGMVAANNYGALNVKNEHGLLKIFFSPLQNIQHELIVMEGNKVVYSKKLDLKTLQLFADSIQFNGDSDSLVVSLGESKLKYEASPSANVLSRPVDTPADFDWNSAYGLYVQGKENMRQRYYALAEEAFKACLQKDPNYMPALTEYAQLQYRNRNYTEALALAKKALSIDTYDPTANYYYGVINAQLGNVADAKDGFDIAALGTEYRSAAYTELAKLYFKENNRDKAIEYARKSLDFNRYAVAAYQLLAVVYRLQNNQAEADSIRNTLLAYDPLNHFAAFEKYLVQNTDETKMGFLKSITNEMPQQTFLELAIWYYNIGRNEDAINVLTLAPQDAEVQYWLAFLQKKPLDVQKLKPDMVFPFRAETATVLEQLISQNDNWLLKYHLGLMDWNNNNVTRAKELFTQCDNQPTYAPFYAARAELFKKDDDTKALADLQKAVQLDKKQWRYGQSLTNYYLAHKEAAKAVAVATTYYKQFPANYALGMQKVKALMLNQQYDQAHTLLNAIQILPYEGATDGRQLYKETELMLAAEAMKSKKYEKALTYIAAARQWPEHLGVGKPYANDIDERLEDWLAYDIYTRQGNSKAAQEMLQKIIAFTELQTANGTGYPSVNNLVSAWAFEKVGQQEKAKALLKQWVEKEPQNAVAQWAMHVYNGQHTALAADTRADENYRILQQWISYMPKP
jgi:predicted Zn-dependent protease